jgi:hypothetical protein
MADLIPTIIGAGVTLKIADTVLNKKGERNMKHHKKHKIHKKSVDHESAKFAKAIGHMKAQGHKNLSKLKRVGI